MGFLDVFRRGVRRVTAGPHASLLEAMCRYSSDPEKPKMLETKISRVSPEVAANCVLFLSEATPDNYINRASYLEIALKHKTPADLQLQAVMDNYEYLCEIGMTPPCLILSKALDVLTEYGNLSLQQQRALFLLEKSRFRIIDFSSENWRVECTEYPAFITDATISMPDEVERIIDLMRTTRVAHRSHLEGLLNGTAVVPLASGEL